MIHEAAARVPRHQQIEIAVGMGFPTGHGTEDTKVMRAVQTGETENVRPPLRPQ